MTEPASNYYARTGHCQQCGDPGFYCTCRTPCPCAALHPVGSAYREGALAAFEQSSHEQDDLFGGTR
jgi:hypothetical protein